MKAQIIFCPGWGMSPRFWDPLVACLPQDHAKPLQSNFFSRFSCQLMDLGYFSQNPSEIWENPDRPLIGVGHSLGLIKLIKLGLPFDALIGLHSFINFCGFDPVLRALRQRELVYFEKLFAKDPLQTLLSFYQKCGLYPYDKTEIESLNVTTLRQDLKELATATVPLPQVPVLILGSADDTIVPPCLLKDNFQSQKNVQLKIFPGQGHLLGYSTPQPVFLALQNFLNVYL